MGGRRIDSLPTGLLLGNTLDAAPVRVQHHFEPSVFDGPACDIARDLRLGKLFFTNENKCLVAHGRKGLGDELPIAMRVGAPTLQRENIAGLHILNGVAILDAVHEGEGEGHDAIPRPGQWVVDHHAQAVDVDILGQGVEVVVERGDHLVLNPQGELVVFGPRDFHVPVIGGQPGGIIPVEIRAMQARYEVLICQAPGMFAPTQALGIGLGNDRRGGDELDAPDHVERPQRFSGAQFGPDVHQLNGGLGRRHRAVNPTVGNRAAYHRKFGLLCQDGLGKVVHTAHGDPGVRVLAADLPDPSGHLIGRVRALVVAGHHHGQPRLVGPVGRRQQAGVVPIGEQRQHARPIGAFPPEHTRHLHLHAGWVGAEVEEFDPRPRQ